MTRTASAPGTPGPELNPYMEQVLGGAFADAMASVRTSSLPPLARSVLLSVAAFEAGEVIVPGAVRWYERATWRLYVGSWLGEALVDGVVRMALGVLTVLGCRRAVVASIANRELANLVHYRYTSFIKGFFYSLMLYHGLGRSRRLERAALRSQLSHSLGLSGRLDRAEAIAIAAIADLGAYHAERNGTDAAHQAGLKDLVAWALYVEALSNLFMIYVYMGDHAKRDSVMRAANVQFARHRYLWSQMFFSVIGLHSATEMLDDQAMVRAASDLQNVFSADAFKTRFALRFSGYTALLLAFEGDYYNAQTQILKGEELYRVSSIPLERARYHYTRSLTELELQRFEKALHHAEKNVSMLAHVQGGVYHVVEARLLRLEVILRTMYARPQLGQRRAQLREVRTELKSLSRRVRGSLIHDTRVRVLALFVNYLRGDYHVVQRRMREVRGGIGSVSKRYEKVLYQLQPGANQIASPILSHDELLHKQNADVIEQLSALCNTDDLRHRSVDLVKMIFGSKDVRLVVGAAEAAHAPGYVIEFRGSTTVLLVQVGLDTYRFDVVGSIISAVNIGLIEPLLKLFSTLLNVTKLHQLENERARVEAIAKTTQMLAHDVRKPFSILRMGMGMLANAKDEEHGKAVLARLLPEVDRALNSVDGLISDVMEIGSTSTQLLQEPASPEGLIEHALGDVFRAYPRSAVTFSYTFAHAHLAHVHVQKVGRVFSNILVNAIQAMDFAGAIWFRTREDGGFIEFCLGNAGSMVPCEVQAKLFDAFFTSGKKGGTGLGLAIADKVVRAHGGKIWCESGKTAEHPEGMVEIYFTLPAAAAMQPLPPVSMPAHSSEISQTLLAISDGPPAATVASADEHDRSLEAEIVEASARLGRPLAVMLIDDEALYRSALRAMLTTSPALDSALQLQEVDGSVDALAMLNKERFDLIITDVDLGPLSLSGFELVPRLRRDLCLATMLCIHSNRMVAADHRTAMLCGADAFLPKPMARGQLLRLLLQAALRTLQHAPASGAGAAALLPEVMVIDDTIFTQEAWVESLHGESIVHLLDSPEALTRKLAQDPGILGRLAFVVTDYNFDNSTGNGLDVGRIVKAHCPERLVLLCSDGEFGGSDFAGSIDQIIPKNPVSYRELLRTIAAYRQQPTTTSPGGRDLWG